MTKQTLSQTIHLPHDQNIKQLIEKTSKITQTFLNNHYSIQLLEDYQKWKEENNCKNYKFFSQVDDYNPFEKEEEYYYNRFKRCVYQSITNLLDTQAEKQQAFQYITENTNGRITSEDKEHLREQLFEKEEFINIYQYEIVLKEINNYYDKHQRQPEKYTQLNQLRKHPKKLPLSPDDNHIHELEISGENIHLTLKTPDCNNPSSYHDYSKTKLVTKIPNHLEKLLEKGTKFKPTLRYSKGQLFLDIPVKLDTVESETRKDRVLACDLGVSTQVTNSVLEKQDEEVKQLSQPEFYNHECKRKLQRLIEERNNTPNNTKQHENLRNKEKHLRKQVQHDIANHLVSKAIANECGVIVLENLSDLQATSGMARTSRHISHWARGDLLEKIKYKANLVGLEVETVNPWKTSKYCSNCGKYGCTIKASNDHEKLDHGGWFHCPSCGFNGDRDYNACLNVGRLHLSQEDRISQCKPVEYTSMGNHAGFPSKASKGKGVRFASVQPSHDSKGNSIVSSSHVKGCKTTGMTSTDPRYSHSTPIKRVLNHTT